MIGAIIISFVILSFLFGIHIMVFGFNGWKNGLIIMGFIDLVILGAILMALGI
jgi:hypothetical protein